MQGAQSLMGAMSQVPVLDTMHDPQSQDHRRTERVCLAAGVRRVPARKRGVRDRSEIGNCSGYCCEPGTASMAWRDISTPSSCQPSVLSFSVIKQAHQIAGGL